MFEHRPNRLAFHGLMVAICLALFAGCKAEVTPAPPGANPDAPIEAPLAPAGLVATLGNAQVSLTWSASSGATSYDVRRATTSGGPYAHLATAMSPSYTDSTVSTGATYFYVVAAANSIGVSANSIQVSATFVTPTLTLAAPAGLSAISENARVTLNWFASSGATSYIVRRSLNNGGPYTQLATTMSPAYTDTAVSNGTIYYYVVAAANLIGTSDSSAQASASPVTPGTLPTVACNNLGAPGTWKNITPPGYNADYRPAAFVVDPNTGLVYLGTDAFSTNSKGVQRSVDCGETWEHVSTGNGSDAINGGRQWTFQINHLDGRIMYTNSGYHRLGLWKSYNGGIDWTDVTPKGDGAPGFAGDLQMDPEDPEHLLLTWHAACNGLNNEFGYNDQVGCFHESKDGGRTWKGHYGSPKWGAEVRVLLLHGSTWVVLASNVLRTTNGGMSFESVAGNSLGGHSSGTLSRTKNGAYFIGTQFGAYRSAPGSDGREWSPVGGQWVHDIEDTGTMLYMPQIVSGIRTSPSGDGITWQEMGAGPTNCGRTGYDPLHKTLYLECGSNGFWRMAVE
jgi:hypothetical protein